MLNEKIIDSEGFIPDWIPRIFLKIEILLKNVTPGKQNQFRAERGFPFLPDYTRSEVISYA